MAHSLELEVERFVGVVVKNYADAAGRVCSPAVSEDVEDFSGTLASLEGKCATGHIDGDCRLVRGWRT